MGINFGRLRFMVVDDSEHMRRLVRLILKSFEVDNVREAGDGSEALELMTGGQAPDILVTNWNMAPLDGIDLVRHIRTAGDSPNKFLPVIMMSAYAERHRVLAARDAGVTEFLVKPLSAKSLYSRISAIIEKPRQFVRTKQFFGPDRRRKKDDAYEGPDRRGEQAEGSIVKPDQVMSQKEINELFNPQ